MPREQELLKAGTNFYVVDLKNIGGLVMPVILGIEYADGAKEELRIPAEIWRYNNTEVSKLIATSERNSFHRTGPAFGDGRCRPLKQLLPAAPGKDPVPNL